MADVSKTVSIVFQGKDEATPSVESINKGLKSLDEGAKSAAGGVSSVNAELEKLAGKDKVVIAVADALKGIGAGIALKEFVEANIAAEKFEKTMTIVTGTTQGATQAFEYVRDVANRLGIEFGAAADVFSKFASATKGTAVEGERAKFIFESFSKAILATGGSTRDISGAFTQLTQGISKGRFELEDLKSIAERIPGFFSQFAESLGVTTADLFKLISAGQIGAVEIERFAKSLNQSFANVEIKGFEADLARLRNTFTDLFVELGKSGAFDALTKGLQVASGAAIGAIATFKVIGETLANVAYSAANKDFSNFGLRLDESLQRAANSVRSIRDRIFELEADGGKSLTNTAKGADGLPLSLTKAGESVKQLDAALKALGLNPDQFREPVEKVIEAFAKLATNADATSEAIISGLLVSLTKVSDPEIIGALGQYAIGALKARGSTDGLVAVTNALAEAQKGAIPKIDEYSKAIKASQEAQKQAAKEAKEAEEKAFKLRLELEKLASNERIKQIEFKVKLDIAKVQADTEKFKLTLESLNQGLKSTGEVINAAFGALSGVGGFYGLEKLDIIRTQLEQENKFRKDQFDLQKALVEEQVKRLRAQTEAIGRGDALIKIDGSGLAPQLEAFMWEILRAIQVRVNRDGLPILLGI